MSSVTGRRIGGGAAWAAAIALVIRVVLDLVAGSALEARVATDLTILVEIAQYAFLLVAVVGLRDVVMELDRAAGSIAFAVGAVGCLGAIAFDAVALETSSPDAIAVWALALAQIAAASWFIAAGTAARRSEGPLSQLGWLGQVGSIGLFIAPVEMIVLLLTDRVFLAPGWYFTVVPVVVAAAFLWFLGRFALVAERPTVTELDR